MSNRIVSWTAAAALTLAATASAFAGEITASTVDAPKVAIGQTPADAAATQSPGTVGAMHYATAGVATSGADVLRQSRGLPTAVFANWVVPVQPGS